MLDAQIVGAANPRTQTDTPAPIGSALALRPVQNLDSCRPRESRGQDRERTPARI